MLNAFYKTHNYLVEHVQVPARRVLMDEINWSDRLIAIKGGRGTGKTDFLLNYAKELRVKNPELAKHTLYVNLSDFYFTEHTLVDLAAEFVAGGGQVLLVDQAYKYPNWSRELSQCYYRYPDLRIVFTATAVMRVVEDNKDIGHIVHPYNLRGFSFREYLNVTLGLRLPVYSLEDILKNHVEIAQQICRHIKPLQYFNDYLHHGFYPLFLEPHDFTESLLKMMNNILDVDVLLVKQVEVSSLPKLRKLVHRMLLETPCGLNVSTLANAIDCSRSTTMNYIKYLKDARLLNLLYPEGKQFPLKPTKVYMQNTNLCYATSTREIDPQAVAETFFYNALHGKHVVNATDRSAMFIIDGKYYMDALATTPHKTGIRYGAIADLEQGSQKNIPLWLFGFLY
jgi:predicted AAA+ superfamily ATPase